MTAVGLVLLAVGVWLAEVERVRLAAVCLVAGMFLLLSFVGDLWGFAAACVLAVVWALCIEARAVRRASDRARMERRKAERRRAQALAGRKAVG